ncbi:MAG: T9SS type A sorting domain-containing protein [Sporocytophaga sp.]|uniref:T9SS type A sorting domain-containing protein n=1 Tax=Sporocytophaga sp. TaxID=2231183 RepID=UPI001B16F31A|nr:T9SS type A sorting domain-containing protein [Sporocytophaga sp.]MBO9699764.1 T9SS type A sorting domain-containing protein [Sporocytophaga sp.]
MKKIFTILAACLLTINYSVKGCTLQFRSFCQSIQNREFIAKGKIISNHDHSLKIKLISTLIGSEQRDTITVWDGTLIKICSPDFEIEMNKSKDLGSVNDTIYFAVNKITEKINDWDVVGDYRFINYYDINTAESTVLEVRNDTVYGFLSGPGIAPPQFWIEKLSEDIFLDRFQDCRQDGKIIIMSTNSPQRESMVSLYPNPVIENTLNVDLNQVNKKYSSIVIKNQLGQHIKTIDISASANMIQVDISDMTPGVVLVELVGDGYTDRRKVIKAQ